MPQNRLIDFYCKVSALIRRDLVKQKMLLPPENILELCREHCRTHRDLKSVLTLPGARSEKNNSKKIVGVIQKNFPEDGTLMADFDCLQQAGKYESAACAAVAVVTEKNFYGGAPSMLTGVTHLVKPPVIRWDFIIDDYQLMQSVLWGADAVRLTVALLDQYELNKFIEQAVSLKLEVVAEVLNQSDWDRIKPLLPQIAAVYIDEPTVSKEELNSLLLQIPADTPALINGDRWNDDLYGFLCDGALFFRGKTPIKD